MDYPNGIQAAINTGMEPLTFALTIVVGAQPLQPVLHHLPVALGRGTPATTALFLGLVSWLLAGLSGVVNATIAWDAFVHNTLWVVGHFHHMALLNIGIVIFGAIYAFLPDLSATTSTATAWESGTSGSRSSPPPGSASSGSSRAWTGPRVASRCCRASTTR